MILSKNVGLLERYNNGLCKTSSYLGRKDGMVTLKEYACGDMYVYFEGRKDGLTRIEEYDIPEGLSQFFEDRQDGKVKEEYDYNPEIDEYVLYSVSYENRKDGLTYEQYYANGDLGRFYGTDKPVILTLEEQKQEKLRKIEANKNNYRKQHNNQKGYRKTIKSRVLQAYRDNRFI